jgi:drug/metabolite transporter (DMT)-like permease
MSHLGEIAAVATSVSWTLCGLAFALAGRRIGALAVNQIRIVIAVAVLAGVHALLHGSAFPLDAAPRQIAFLAASGIAGLAWGDSFYYHAIAVLGPRVGAVLMATFPLMCAWIAWAARGEALGGLAWLGMLLTLAGVVAVLADPRGEPTWQRGGSTSGRGFAIACGLLGALGQAGGLVLSKMGMVDAGAAGAAPISSLSATLVRMVAGAAGILAIGLVAGRWRAAVHGLRDRRALGATLVGVLFGPTLGVWLSMVAVRNTGSGIAAALCALPPVMMIPIARVAYGARPGPAAIVGTVLATLGAALLFWRAGA